MPRAAKLENGLTAKQEKFAHKFIEIGNATKAYRQAGYAVDKCKPATINRRAKELLDNGMIAARIEELRQEMSDKNKVTLDYIIEGMKDVIQRSAQKDDLTNYRNAHMDLAKLCGLIVDKSHVTGDVKVDTPHKQGVVERFLERSGK